MDLPRSEWRGAVDFAEYAEALDVPTDQVMAVFFDPDSGKHVILYSDEYQGDATPFYRAIGRRDADSILVVAPSEPLGTLGDLADDVGQQLQKHL